MRSIFLAGAAILASSMCFAPAANAGVYLEMINGTQSTGLLSGGTSIDVSGITVGNYDIGAGVVNESANNPMAVDFANFSTTGGANPGVLQVFVSVTGLTAPIGSVINYLTQATGNIISGSLVGMYIQTYVDNTDTVGGMQTLLSTLSIGSYGSGSTYNESVAALYQLLTGGPFSETFVIDLQLASNSDISSDTDLDPTIPEPASYAMLATGLLGMLAMRKKFRV
jgi:hypothetical protein